MLEHQEHPFSDEDVLDNENMTAPTPSAPPLEKMDAIPGYNNLGFDTGNDFNLRRRRRRRIVI